MAGLESPAWGLLYDLPALQRAGVPLILGASPLLRSVPPRPGERIVPVPHGVARGKGDGMWVTAPEEPPAVLLKQLFVGWRQLGADGPAHQPDGHLDLGVVVEAAHRGVHGFPVDALGREFGGKGTGSMPACAPGDMEPRKLRVVDVAALDERVERRPYVFGLVAESGEPAAKLGAAVWPAREQADAGVERGALRLCPAIGRHTTPAAAPGARTLRRHPS